MYVLFIDDNSTVQKVNIMMSRKFNYINAKDQTVFKNTTNVKLEKIPTPFDVIICDLVFLY